MVFLLLVKVELFFFSLKKKKKIKVRPSQAEEKPFIAENKSVGIHCSVLHNFFFGGKISVLYKGCFKTLKAYLCRCLEVNTLPRVTKQPNYLSWSLSNKFSTYRPDKYFCILFLLWKFGGKNFCLMHFSVTFDASHSDLAKDTTFKFAVF